MPLIKYEDKKIGADRLAIIDKANEIIADYRRQGYILTLRQLYYQFVARDIIKNKQSEYKRLGDIVSDGRRAGLIDWDAIEDRTRNLSSPSFWKSPSSIIATCADAYRVDLWEDQAFRPEVWVEKEALAGVVEVACEPLRVPHFACRGYASDSEMWAAGRRFADYFRDGKEPVIFHLGDHDPSGIDMTRDIIARVRLFADIDDPIRVERLALNMDQIEEYAPPPNPAKVTDARYDGYEAIYGDESWELDALDPATLSRLIDDSVNGLIDRETWDAAIEREDGERKLLGLAASGWKKIAKTLGG